MFPMEKLNRHKERIPMNNLLLKNATIYYNDSFIKADMLIENGVVSNISKSIFANENTSVVDCEIPTVMMV